MTTYRVFQVQLNDAQVDAVNQNGWDGTDFGSAYMKATFGSGNEIEQTANFENAYKAGIVRHTMIIKDAVDVDEVFAIGNCMGNMDKIAWELTKDGHSAHKSISVGDLIVDADNNGYLVANFGFTKVSQDFVREFETIVPQVVIFEEKETV